MMETWYSIYDEKGKESGEVLLEAKVEETGRDVQGAYMSHGGPLLSRQNVRFQERVTGVPLKRSVRYVWSRSCFLAKAAA